MSTRFSFEPEIVPDSQRPAILGTLGLTVADRIVLIGTLFPDRLRSRAIDGLHHDEDFVHRLRDRLHHINELAHDRTERLRLDVRCVPVDGFVGVKRCYLVGRGDMALAMGLGAFSMTAMEACETAADIGVACHERDRNPTSEVFTTLRDLVGGMRDSGHLRTCPDSIAEMHAVHYGSARHFVLLHDRDFDPSELREAIGRARVHRYPVEHAIRSGTRQARQRPSIEAPSL